MSETQSIYDIILRDAPVARADIAKKYGKRPATITAVTNKLLHQNLICKCGLKPPRRGRALQLLKINPDAFNVLGLHTVSNGFRVVITSSDGKIKFYKTILIDHGNSGDDFLAGLGQAVKQILKQAANTGNTISGIGLALPGEVDYKIGRLVKAALILPELEDVPCKEYLEKRFQLPVVVDHDAVMMTYAEFLWGTDCTINSMVTLFVGQGIGGRFIINGQIFRGAGNRAGEFGHIPLRRNRVKCKCGLHGCLEAMASIPVIEGQYPGNLPFHEIVVRAKNEDACARNILNRTGEYISEAAAMIFDIIDVDMMLINGDIIAAEKLIKKTIIKSVKKYSHIPHPANMEIIRFSKFGSEVCAVGAAAEAVQTVLANYGITLNKQ